MWSFLIILEDLWSGSFHKPQYIACTPTTFSSSLSLKQNTHTTSLPLLFLLLHHYHLVSLIYHIFYISFNLLNHFLGHPLTLPLYLKLLASKWRDLSSFHLSQCSCEKKNKKWCKNIFILLKERIERKRKEKNCLKAVGMNFCHFMYHVEKRKLFNKRILTTKKCICNFSNARSNL